MTVSEMASLSQGIQNNWPHGDFKASYWPLRSKRKQIEIIYRDTQQYVTQKVRVLGQVTLNVMSLSNQSPQTSRNSAEKEAEKV